MKEKAESSAACNHHRVGFLGLLVTLGIVFGDIGTSPLYVMKAILHTGESISESTILGALSCIIWTLTLQTTIKYVCVALRADNNGEGGILALYALLRRLKSKWIYLLAIIGASTLLADGIITPAITVLQASETPGLGAKAATWFQKDGKGSIIGKTPKDGDLHVSKDDKSGNAVDAITASTITSRAFLKAINQAYAVYAKKDVDGESGASQKADAESGASKVEHNDKKG